MWLVCTFYGSYLAILSLILISKEEHKVQGQNMPNGKLELEQLYQGVLDDSVNLTFRDLAQVQQKPPEKTNRIVQDSPLQKLPSIDFKLALQQVKSRPQFLHQSSNHHHQNHHRQSRDHLVLDDISSVSTSSTFADKGATLQRPGIPHSNICTICATYIYIFRHRCLVCGRVYCRNCVNLGMGELTEGRKCIQCLGSRFSPRYIKRAGKVPWCFRYPATVKQTEVKWAEKGPRRSGEDAYGHRSAAAVIKSRSKTPMSPRSPMGPKRAHHGTRSSNDHPSFVAPSSLYTPTRHLLPL